MKNLKNFENEITYNNGGSNILGEEKSLGFDDEEVDQLIEITGHAVQGLLWQGVVSAWAELRDETGVEESLSGNLSGSGQTECHPGDLEGITKEIEVASTEDEKHNGDVGNGGSTWVLPAEKSGEEGVVVGEVLAGSCALVWTLAAVGKVGELVGGLVSLILQVLSNRAIDGVPSQWVVGCGIVGTVGG